MVHSMYGVTHEICNIWWVDARTLYFVTVVLRHYIVV